MRIHISDGDLLIPLQNETPPLKREAFHKLMKVKHQEKRDAWRSFLKAKIPSDFSNRFTIVEIGQGKRKGIRPEQSIYGAVREACTLEKISSQMLKTVKPKETSVAGDDTLSSYINTTKGRVLQAVLDVTLRHIGVLYGSPSKVYSEAGLPAKISQSLDMIALCRFQNKSKDVHYAIAVRLRAEGTVDVMLPSEKEWIPYAQAGAIIGSLFSDARSDQLKNGKYRTDSKIKLQGRQLAELAARITTQKLERPTIVVLEAEGWRNERGQYEDSRVWPQLKNEHLAQKQDVLDFQHVFGHNCVYRRDDPALDKLLAVVRLRDGKETPQYIPDRDFWNEDNPARNFTRLSGFCDTQTSKLLHYFSVGRLPITQKTQDDKANRDLYMLASSLNESGATIAFKHQQIVEMVPFFIHPNFQTDEGRRTLCRCPHYLRTSPAYMMGNILHPYPMHLGNQLMADQLCILGVEG